MIEQKFLRVKKAEIQVKGETLKIRRKKKIRNGRMQGKLQVHMKGW